jgi:hypothetical protein
VVKSVKGSLQLTIIAHEQTAIMHQVKKCRAWHGLTLQQMADQIQGEYQAILGWENDHKDDGQPGGLLKSLGALLSGKPDQSKLPPVKSIADGIGIVHALQACETDAAFIARMAKKFGVTFSLSSRGKIQFHEIDLKRPPVRTITWRGGAGDWKEFDIENDITGLVGAVTVKGVDTSTKKRVEAKASNDKTKRDGLMPVIETDEPFDKKTLESTFRDRIASSTQEHSGANEAGTEQLQAKAEAKFKASQRSTIKLNGTLIGDPGVCAKQILVVNGLGKRVSGKYHLVQTRHHIDDKGRYITKFAAKTDGHGGYAAEAGVVNTPNQADPNREKAKDAGGDGVQTKEVFDRRTVQSHLEFHQNGTDTQ